MTDHKYKMLAGQDTGEDNRSLSSADEMDEIHLTSTNETEATNETTSTTTTTNRKEQPPSWKPLEIEEYEEEENNSDNNDDNVELGALLPEKESPIIQLYRQRWIQLGYLSLLAMLSDWICFSVAASSDKFEELYDIEDSTELIDWFLFTNVVSCFFVTDLVAKIGLQNCIRLSSILMAIGSWFRAYSFLHNYNYPFFVIGTLMVGAAQPFFQCTPPLLSALWFASNERATATAIALNFNQIGIAVAFMIGGPMGSTVGGLRIYFTGIAVLGSLLAVGTCIQFQAKPKTPPSVSEWSKLQSNYQEPPFYKSAKQFLSNAGFRKALSAFICSIAITNVVGALIEEVMNRGGVTETWQVSLAGGVFEITIVLGGIVLGGYVDRTKNYKQVTLACLVVSILLVLPLGLTDHRLGQKPGFMVVSLFLLGFFVGPIQPINAELAVDVTYPGDETAVESVQQIGGNLISALLMPCVEWAAKKDYQLFKKIPTMESDIRGDIVVLLIVSVGTLFYFSSMKAPLRRTMADERLSGGDK